MSPDIQYPTLYSKYWHSLGKVAQCIQVTVSEWKSWDLNVRHLILNLRLLLQHLQFIPTTGLRMPLWRGLVRPRLSQAPLSMGFPQARIPERIAISLSRGSSRPRDRTQVSCIPGGLLHWQADSLPPEPQGWPITRHQSQGPEPWAIPALGSRYRNSHLVSFCQKKKKKLCA